MAVVRAQCDEGITKLSNSPQQGTNLHYQHYNSCGQIGHWTKHTACALSVMPMANGYALNIALWIRILPLGKVSSYNISEFWMQLLLPPTVSCSLPLLFSHFSYPSVRFSGCVSTQSPVFRRTSPPHTEGSVCRPIAEEPRLESLCDTGSKASEPPIRLCCLLRIMNCQLGINACEISRQTFLHSKKQGLELTAR